MPHKKRGHGHHKHPKEDANESQPKEAAPKPATRASTVKPAQFEKVSSGSSSMATKPVGVTTATGKATAGSVVAAGGSASFGTAGKAETNTSAAGAAVIDMSTAGSTVVDMTSSGPRGGPKDMSKTSPVPQVKATATVPSPTAGGKPKESPKDTAKSATAITTLKADLPKVVQEKKEEAKSTSKVQVEVPPAAAKGAPKAPELDPFDALASILPSADSVLRPEPVYTGPEVKEHGVTSEVGKGTGFDDRTLPPGYRFEDMGPLPVDIKPFDIPKPMTSDEALDSLSFGFGSPTVPAEPKKPEGPAPLNIKPTDIPKPMTSDEALDSLSFGFESPKKPEMKGNDSVSASTAGPANFAPPPVKESKPAAPPADKKAKMDAFLDDFSLESLLPSATAKTNESSAVPKNETKPKIKKDDSLSLDALSALSDSLPEDKPKPESPKLRPEDMVKEDKHKKEKGVLVGEREDSRPPEYRSKEDTLNKLPAPKPEPTMDAGEAMDALLGDFSSAAAFQAPVIKPSAPPAQTKVDDLSALDILGGDFVAPSKAAGVSAPAPPPANKKTEIDSLSLDAFSALSDTLPQDKPKPESPKLRPEDMVKEDKHKTEKGVLVGEREDSRPPEYRFKEDQLNKLPAPKPEPTMNTNEAMDALMGDFSLAAPAFQAPVIKPSAPPAQPSADFALNALADEFVSSAAAPVVKSAAYVPVETAPHLEGDADNALDALSDCLADIKPIQPQPAPVPAKDLVKEKKILEEKLIKMGERDDSLPPEYRPTEEDLKKMAEEKAKAAAEPKKKTMDDKTALDLLSSDFSTEPEPPVAVASSAATAKLEPPVLDSEPLKPMAGPVLDKLSSTLLPDAPEFKPKTEKPKKHHAEQPPADDVLSAELSSDVVPTSTKKGGKS